MEHMEPSFETEVLTRLAVIESKLDGYKEVKSIAYSAEIEVSLTNNKAISEVNEDIGSLQEKQIQMRKYSTEEQVVGTWIDGKPLYRKVLQTTLNGTYKEGDYTYTWFTFDSSSSMVVNIRIFIFDNNKTYFNDNPAINYLIENNKTLRVGIKSSIPANSSMTIIVEYTKTTD